MQNSHPPTQSCPPCHAAKHPTSPIESCVRGGTIRRAHGFMVGGRVLVAMTALAAPLSGSRWKRCAALAAAGAQSTAAADCARVAILPRRRIRLLGRCCLNLRRQPEGYTGTSCKCGTPYEGSNGSESLRSRAVVVCPTPYLTLSDYLPALCFQAARRHSTVL